MNIILLGPPGSGKGTQGEYLEKSLNIKRISTGDILRNEIEAGSEIGKTVQDIISKGYLVSDEIIMEIIGSNLVLEEYVNGFILDGFPRNLDQAKLLEALLEKLNKKISLVLFFAISDQVLIERICNRYYCAKCGASYNKIFKLPIVSDQCDVCGSKDFKVREDDNIESVSSRMQQYRAKTEPLALYYQNKDILRSINSDQAVDKISKDIEILVKNG